MFILMAFLSIFNLIFSESPILEISYVALIIGLSSLTFTILGRLFKAKPNNSHQTKWAARGATAGALMGAIILYFFDIDISSPALNYLSACVAGVFLAALIEALRKKVKNA
tara:strand:- start:186 stop:518 length:333 start_codon:yes stop_codon:yes gene_type:complete